MSHPTALIVIDVQESFRHRPYWSTQSPQAIDRYFGHQNALIQGAQRSGLPIVRVMHVEGPDHADNPFSLASGHVRPLQELAPFDAALTVSKRRHSALVGTELMPWLRRMGIARLIVSGIRTEQCCETTARHASDEGFEVDYVSEATLTFDMHVPALGHTLSADEIRVRTETVLHGRFANVCGVDAALARYGCGPS